MVYLTMLSAFKAALCRMAQWLLSNELGEDMESSRLCQHHLEATEENHSIAEHSTCEIRCALGISVTDSRNFTGSLVLFGYYINI
jgi:hypothetical protein